MFDRQTLLLTFIDLKNDYESSLILKTLNNKKKTEFKIYSH